MQNSSLSLKKTIIKIFKIQKMLKENTETMNVAANKIKLSFYFKKAVILSTKAKAAKKIQRMFKNWKKIQGKED